MRATTRPGQGRPRPQSPARYSASSPGRGRRRGLAWIVAGILGATLGAVYSAWIVLVEILR